eukprot:3208704-Prymnesium_polylepis.1
MDEISSDRFAVSFSGVQLILLHSGPGVDFCAGLAPAMGSVRLGLSGEQSRPASASLKFTARILGQDFRCRAICVQMLVPGLTEVLKADPPQFRGQNPKPN